MRSIIIDEISDATRIDSELQELLKLIGRKNGQYSLPKNLYAYKFIFHELSSTEEGLLLRGQNVIVPAALRHRVADLAHVGYQSVVKTKRLIRSRLW